MKSSTVFWHLYVCSESRKISARRTVADWKEDNFFEPCLSYSLMRPCQAWASLGFSLVAASYVVSASSSLLVLSSARASRTRLRRCQ
jgi:hypothetical protein